MTRLLAPVVKSIRAYDASQHMLDNARASMESTGLSNWALEVGDNRALPTADASADLSVAGWSFGHATGWYIDYWREMIDKSVSEMLRVLKPGGTAIILESLGTGTETPHPPDRKLAAYYDWLETERSSPPNGFAPIINLRRCRKPRS
jgi:ubiquinone/menaquinone biosynthesis C-methylase UbiE